MPILIQCQRDDSVAERSTMVEAEPLDRGADRRDSRRGGGAGIAGIGSEQANLRLGGGLTNAEMLCFFCNVCFVALFYFV